jgi:hypothetical protein
MSYKADSIFFSLPPEIREMVYEYALAAEKPIHRIKHDQPLTTQRAKPGEPTHRTR